MSIVTSTADLRTDRPGPSTRSGTGLNRGASYLVASGQVAVRTLKQFVRTPALIIGATAQGVLFQGMGAASGVAADLEGGLFDRLRSLPIRLLSIVTGRVGADTALVAWGALIMTAVGFAVGFRLGGTTADGMAAFGLTVLFGFAFVWLFITMGLAAGSPQAAQSLSFLVFPLSFVSSAYVPVSTMPGWMQGFATYQPMTPMVNTVRILTGGPQAQALLGHPLSYYLVPALLWTVGIEIGEAGAS